MNETLLIAGHEYRINVRRRGFILTTLIVPVVGLIALLVGSFFSDQDVEAMFGPPTTTQPVGVVDNTGQLTPILPEYREQFRAFDSAESGRAALRSETLSALLIIPPDYLETGTVRALSRGDEHGINPVYRANIDAFFQAHLLRDQLSPTLRARVLDPYTLETAVLDSTGAEDAQGDGAGVVRLMVAYSFGVLLVISIFFSSTYLLRSVAAEKENRIMEILVSSVRPEHLLAGKILGLGALGLTQVFVGVAALLVLSLVGVQLFDFPATWFTTILDAPGVLALALVYYLLGFLVYAVLMGGVGALGSSLQESQQVAGIFTFFAILPVMFAGILIASPNALLARVLSYIPLTAPTAMLLRLPLTEVPLIDIGISIGVIVLVIPVALWASTKLFRAGMLLYGQRPGLQQIVHILRQT
jgi:ABC-2 type transport system permease protein